MTRSSGTMTDNYHRWRERVKQPEKPRIRADETALAAIRMLPRSRSTESCTDSSTAPLAHSRGRPQDSRKTEYGSPAPGALVAAECRADRTTSGWSRRAMRGSQEETPAAWQGRGRASLREARTPRDTGPTDASGMRVARQERRERPGWRRGARRPAETRAAGERCGRACRDSRRCVREVRRRRDAPARALWSAAGRSAAEQHALDGV